MIARKDIPNLLTISRVVLVAPILVLLSDDRYAAALGLFAVAGVSDGLDGYLAKRYGWQSRFGSLMDPLADKLLLISCYLVLGAKGLLPSWLVFAVILRDVVIFCGGVAYHFIVETLEGQPNVLSKINTFFQIVLVLIVVADQAGAALVGGAVSPLTYTVLATTVLSGVVYVVTWSRRAVRRRAQR